MVAGEIRGISTRMTDIRRYQRKDIIKYVLYNSNFKKKKLQRKEEQFDADL
jgi:hypothetical protein